MSICLFKRTRSLPAFFSGKFLRLITVCLVMTYSLANVGTGDADVVQGFDVVAGIPSGEFGWDDFNGSTYGGPHTPDQFSTGAGSASMHASPSPGAPGGIIGGNLYSFTTIPTWDIDLNGLANGNAFTSIAVQVATTADASGNNLNLSNFLLDGQSPDEFVDLGVRVSIAGNGGAATPVNFYWAEWIGETALTDYSISVSGAGGFHQLFTGAKVTYFNTKQPLNVASIPEPGSATVLGSIGLAILMRRRSSRA